MAEKALQIAVKRKEAKGKGEKERYTHLNAEFQRITRRDKKAFLSDQCKEIEENNRMEKNGTPVFLPGESQGWGSLVGCRLWGLTELDTLTLLSSSSNSDYVTSS